MKKILTIYILLLIIFSGCSKRESKPEFGIITFYKGDIKINIGNKNIKPKLKLVLRDKDSITTGDNSRIDIQLGTFGIIRVSENTHIEINSVLDNIEKYITKLNSGEVLCKLNKLKKNQEFSVETPTAVAGVRGTTFLVKTKKEKSEVAVSEGKVEVASKKEPEKKKVITKNQSAKIDNISKIPQIIKKINIDDLKKLKNIKRINIIKDIKSMDINSLKKLKGLLKNNKKGKDNQKINKKIENIKKQANEAKNKLEKEKTGIKQKSEKIKAQADEAKKKLEKTKNNLKKKFGF